MRPNSYPYHVMTVLEIASLGAARPVSKIFRHRAAYERAVSYLLLIPTME